MASKKWTPLEAAYLILKWRAKKARKESNNARKDNQDNSMQKICEDWPQKLPPRDYDPLRKMCSRLNTAPDPKALYVQLKAEAEELIEQYGQDFIFAWVEQHGAEPINVSILSLLSARY
jgi:hypothetical protein